MEGIEVCQKFFDKKVLKQLNRLIGHCETILSYPFNQSDKDLADKYRKLHSCQKKPLALLIEKTWFYVIKDLMKTV